MHTDFVHHHLGVTDTAVSLSDHGDVHPTLNVAACTRVVLIPFRLKAPGYAFKLSLRLHAEETIHRNDIGVEVTTLLEAKLQIIIIILLICHLETLLW